jgi:ribose-phosphate pyrophosphokinase
MFIIEALPDLTEIEYTSFVFPGGEVQVRVLEPQRITYLKEIRITAHLFNTEKIFELGLLTDALRRLNHNLKIYLVCPYFPYCQQDRVAYPGESLAIKFMANFINALKFEEVEVWDAHSDVALALIDNVVNIGPEILMENMIYPFITGTVLVSPDAGAMKKVAKVSKKYGIPMITASKIRNTNTGEITGTEINIPNELIGHKFLIVDDICIGGKTFTELAKAIRKSINGGKNQISLYVTHGIFSKGIDVLHDAGINQIYTANPFPKVDLTNPYLTVVRK